MFKMNRMQLESQLGIVSTVSNSPGMWGKVMHKQLIEYPASKVARTSDNKVTVEQENSKGIH